MTSVDAPDWTNHPAIGGGVVLDTETLSFSAGQSNHTAFVQVLGYQALLVSVTPTSISGGATITVEWSTDSVGALVFGNQTVFHKGSTVQTLVPIAVQGPYCRVFMAGSDPGSSATIQVTLYGVIASGSAPIVPPATLLSEQGASLGATATIDYSPLVCIPGRHRLWLYADQLCCATVQRWDGTAWDDVLQRYFGSTTPSQANQDLEFVAPADEWRLAVANTVSTAATLYLAATGPY